MKTIEWASKSNPKDVFSRYNKKKLDMYMNLKLVVDGIRLFQ